MRDHDEHGFSLIELIITVGVLGLLFAFSVPGLRSISASFQLHGATENVAAQLRLARERAIATGEEQPLHVPSTMVYHLHYPAGIGKVWTLPRGITFTAATVGDWYYMAPDGRFYQNAGHSAVGSNILVLRNKRGELDTVSVQPSGLILIR